MFSPFYSSLRTSPIEPKNEWLRYALIMGIVLHLYVIINQFVEPGNRSFLSMFFSLIPFLTVISPGLVLNILAYRYDNRILALLASFAYLNTGFFFILTMLWLIVPGAFCMYAFFTMKKSGSLFRFKRKS